MAGIDFAPITGEFAEDAAQVAKLIAVSPRCGLEDEPRVWHAGRNGTNSDVTASSRASKRGWDATVVGV